MSDEVHIFEGKTSTEAIENGLKALKVSKNKVDIKILESEEKRNFFSILTPRVVKVEMKLKEGVVPDKEEHKENPAKKREYKEVNVEEVEKNIRNFLDEFLEKLPTKGLTYTIKNEENLILVDINGDDTGYLIGYRGEVLNSVQTIVSNVASKSERSKVRVVVNIGGYREKREKDLEVLAEKIAGTVIKTKKSITLEPMMAYERKIIHLKLQDNDKVKTYSVGEEPHRKVVVALK